MAALLTAVPWWGPPAEAQPKDLRPEGMPQPAPPAAARTVGRDTEAESSRRSQGFYDTSERMGVGFRVDSARTTVEFTWARLPHRRLSLGIWVEANWLDTLPERLYATGGGLEATLFPMLPVRWKPWGLYVSGAAGGIQKYTRTYAWRGGEVRLFAEAGWFGHSGRRHFLIPRVAARRTWQHTVRHRRITDRASWDTIVAGLEVRLGRVVPGVTVLFSPGRTVWGGSLRFAYRDPKPARS